MIAKKARAISLDKFRLIILNSRINLCFNKLLYDKIMQQLNSKSVILNE